MKKRCLVLTCLIIVALFVSAGPLGCFASKTETPQTVTNATFVRYSEVQLAQVSDIIVIGTITQVLPATRGTALSSEDLERMRAQGLSQESINRVIDGEAQVEHTPVILKVDEQLKGITSPELQFRVIGNNLQSTSADTETFPTFSPGETVVLFLGKVLGGNLEPLAVYRVSGTEAKSRDLGNNGVVDLAALKDTILEHRDEPLAR